MAQRYPTADQLDKRVSTGQMGREEAIHESDRIQSDLLKKALKEMKKGTKGTTEFRRGGMVSRDYAKA